MVEAILKWPEAQLLTALERAVAARLITLKDEFAERYQFSHGLIREVLYQQQIPRRRKQLHAEISALLEGHSAPDGNRAAPSLARRIGELAYHTYVAQQWDKALHYNTAAGESANQQFARRSAVQHYEQALVSAQNLAGESGPQQFISLYERLGELYILLNHREKADIAFSQMVRVARQMGDEHAEGRALCQLSLIQGWLHRLDEARESGAEALHLAERLGDSYLLAQNHLNLGHLGIISGNLQPASHHLQQAEQIARPIAASNLLARTLQNQAYITVFTARYAEAAQLAQLAVESALQSGDALALTGAHFVLGFVLTEQGFYAQARRMLQLGLEHTQLSGESHYQAKLLNTMGYLHCELGDFDGALHWDHKALEACRQSERDRNWEAKCYSLLNLATDEVRMGHIQQAERYRHEVELLLPQAQMSRFRFLNRYYLLCAEVALARDEPDLALSNVQQAGEIARSQGMTKNVIKGLILEGQAYLRLGELEGAASRLEDSVRLADEIEHLSLRWQSRLRLAEVYALLGRANGDLFEQATALVNSIADNFGDDSLRSSFLASSLVIELLANAKSPLGGAANPVGSPVPAVGLPVRLTEREVAIVRLIAQGATNRHIAETLMISVKTVNAHVTNIFNKIGCPNRAAAAAFAVQQGLV